MSFPELAERIQSLPPYLFLEIDRSKRAARASGVDIIDFGIGDPDHRTPDFIIKSLFKALKDVKTHQYPLDFGHRDFRQAIADWYKRRFRVTLDADHEILPLIGSKEGITHIPLAFINPDDRVLIQEPGYPAYKNGVLFAGGDLLPLPTYAENGYLPDWKEVERAGLYRVKMAFLNYPNNPTSATATVPFFEQTVRFAKKNKIIICHDNAYSEIYDGTKKPVSFLQAKGAKDVGIEFHSLSKTFNMTGWRIGFACGNARVISGLAKLKSNIDSGIFSAIQLAGRDALAQSEPFTKKMNRIYSRRRTLLVQGLRSIGLNPYPSRSTFYVWCPITASLGDSSDCCKRLLKEAGVVATPGVGFGQSGEGYIRFALTVPESRILEAIDRLTKVI